ncbi:hypothetical protein ACFHYQ_01605 [Sphaerimonospora cavernae]|uniref:Cell division protein FtsL n=1 Tax=Sphaerimonospora cavernae TaxID=1740611 RepID=A0ABV6TXQ3_9ACTN
MRTAQQPRPKSRFESRTQIKTQVEPQARAQAKPKPETRSDPRSRQEVGPVRVTRTATAGASAPMRRAPRAPFVLLVIGLMCGGLVTLLLLNVTLAQGTYKERDLRSSIDELRQQAALQEKQVRDASQPEALKSRAPSDLVWDDSPPSFITSRPADGTR